MAFFKLVLSVGCQLNIRSFFTKLYHRGASLSSYGGYALHQVGNKGNEARPERTRQCEMVPWVPFSRVAVRVTSIRSGIWSEVGADGLVRVSGMEQYRLRTLLMCHVFERAVDEAAEKYSSSSINIGVLRPLKMQFFVYFIDGKCIVHRYSLSLVHKYSLQSFVHKTTDNGHTSAVARGSFLFFPLFCSPLVFGPLSGPTASKFCLVRPHLRLPNPNVGWTNRRPGWEEGDAGLERRGPFLRRSVPVPPFNPPLPELFASIRRGPRAAGGPRTPADPSIGAPSGGRNNGKRNSEQDNGNSSSNSDSAMNTVKLPVVACLANWFCSALVQMSEFVFICSALQNEFWVARHVTAAHR